MIARCFFFFFPGHPTSSKSMTLKIFITDLVYRVPYAHLHTDLKSFLNYLNQLTQEKELLLYYLKGDDMEILYVFNIDIIFERFQSVFAHMHKCRTLRYRVNTTRGRDSWKVMNGWEISEQCGLGFFIP